MSRTLSLELQEQLQREIEEYYGEIPMLRSRIYSGEKQLLHEVGRFAEARFQAILNAWLQARELDMPDVQQDTLFGSRIQQIVMQRLMSEPLSARHLVFPAGYEDEAERYVFPRSGQPVHAIVVEHLAHVTNEIYPLLVDAYVYDFDRHGQPARNLICIHTSWLNENLQAQRAFFYYPEQDEIIEKNLREPLALNSVQFLAVTPATHQQYSRLAEKMSIWQVNPYPTADEADNKYHCYQRWKAAGVQTPRAVLAMQSFSPNHEFVQHEIEKAFRLLFGYASTDTVTLVLQPNRGTEGRRTYACHGSKDWNTFSHENPGLIDQAMQILRDDDLLLREGVGNILYCRDESDSGALFDVRLNIVDGQAESGFLMVANSGEFIASPGQQGHVVEWFEREEILVRSPERIKALKIPGNEWRIITDCAEQAAACFKDCHMVGVDIRIEYRGEPSQWIAWVLDINPRPAGLAHSCYIENKEPGVTMRLWELLDVQSEMVD